MDEEKREALVKRCMEALGLIMAKAKRNHAVCGDWDEFETFYLPKYATSPASSSISRHPAGDNFDGGLAVHTASVAITGMKLAKTVAPGLSLLDVALAALFHDVHKAGLYNENILKNGKRSEATPFERRKDLIPLGDELESVAILTSLFPSMLKDRRSIVQAVAYHAGAYTPSGREVSFKEHPLTYVLHWADVWSCRFIGEAEPVEWMTDDIRVVDQTPLVSPVGHVKEYLKIEG